MRYKIMTDNFEFRSINPDEVEQAIAIEQICFPPVSYTHLGGDLSRIYPFQKHSYTGGEAYKAFAGGAG